MKKATLLALTALAFAISANAGTTTDAQTPSFAAPSLANFPVFLSDNLFIGKDNLLTDRVGKESTDANSDDDDSDSDDADLIANTTTSSDDGDDPDDDTSDDDADFV